MNCPGKQRRVSQYLEGRLSRREMGRVAAHLAVCTACRRLRAEYLALGAELRELSEPRLPQDLPRRAVERWAARRAAATAVARRSPFVGAAALGTAVGAALLVVLLAHSVVPSPRSRSSETKPLRLAQEEAARPDSRAPRPTAPPTRAGGSRRATEGHRASGLASDGVAPSDRPDSARQSRRARERSRAPARGRDAAHGVVDDLTSMNDGDPRVSRSGRSMRPNAWERLEATAGREAPGRDDFIRVPFPRLAGASDRLAVAAVESYQREAAVVDPRLARRVTLQQKATALSDLCEGLRADTGIQLASGPSVADEKVTVFSEKQPLRDVMRQLSRPFGYTWIRSGKTGEYKYELVQDLRSQLLEEELRNRDRNVALLALDREMERYRKYLGLSPDEALARSKSASPEEKKLLDRLAIDGWGPAQMYFRLSANDMTTLRTGQGITFSAEPKPGERPLPPDVARGVIQSWRDWRARIREDGAWELQYPGQTTPDAQPLTSFPEVKARVTLWGIGQGALGQAMFGGLAGTFATGDRPKGWLNMWSNGPLAVAESSAVLPPDNARINARLAGDPALRIRVALKPQPSCRPAPAPDAAGGSAPEPRVTTADVLEALHHATGMPIVSDHYTRLYKPGELSMRNIPLFEALNRLADAMRMRWSKDLAGGWLQFRSTTYFHDRIKEVPNRLLAHWSAARRQHGALTLDDLVEIAQLPDAQLGAMEMAEGARDCFGLVEWDLARNGNLRPALRYLAAFTPAQRQEAMGPAGLPFTRMSLAQQQQFLSVVLLEDGAGLQSLDELAGAALRVDYTQPGGFQWGAPNWLEWTRWVIPVEPGPQGKRALRPLVRERTREAALQAARRADPRADESRIAASGLDLTILYLPGTSSARDLHVFRWDGYKSFGTW